MGLTVTVVAIVLIINAFASVVVLRVPVFSPLQRFLQIALVWLVPIIGAVICVAFAYSQSLGPASPGTMDPLYLPSDGGGPETSGSGTCGCNGGDAGAGGGGDGD